jgi:hypothetical protein
VAFRSALSHVLLPLPAARLRADLSAARAHVGREEGARGGGYTGLPARAAGSALTWRALPRAVARLRARYTGAQLSAARAALAALAAPHVELAEAVFDREAPCEGSVGRDMEFAAGKKAHPYFSSVLDEGYRDVPAMHCGDPVDASRGPPGTALPERTVLGDPALYFCGNDDAGVSGAMRTPLRWTMFAHYALLVGGAPAAAVAAAACARLSAARAAGAGAPCAHWRLHAWAGLTAVASPADVGTEAGTFALFALCYDSVRTLAVDFHRVASQSRPAHERPQPPPTFLPATLALVPRLLAHPGLRALPAGCGAPALPPPAVPRWAVEDAAWTLLEGVEGGAAGAEEGAAAQRQGGQRLAREGEPRARSATPTRKRR